MSTVKPTDLQEKTKIEAKTNKKYFVVTVICIVKQTSFHGTLVCVGFNICLLAFYYLFAWCIYVCWSAVIVMENYGTFWMYYTKPRTWTPLLYAAYITVGDFKRISLDPTLHMVHSHDFLFLFFITCWNTKPDRTWQVGIHVLMID